jgi:hypothetical protein
MAADPEPITQATQQGHFSSYQQLFQSSQQQSQLNTFATGHTPKLTAPEPPITTQDSPHKCPPGSRLFVLDGKLTSPTVFYPEFARRHRLALKAQKETKQHLRDQGKLKDRK